MYPADTRRRFNVYKPAIRRRGRRIDVLLTFKRRRVSTGYKLQRIVNAREILRVIFVVNM